MFEHLTAKRNVLTRSISPENFKGEKGKGAMAIPERPGHPARELGQGWKVSPYIMLQPHSVYEFASIEGMGAINHIWLTLGHNLDVRRTVIRMYWDGSEEPAVECPVSDFFCAGAGVWQISSLCICLNSTNGYNSYFRMPFRKGCRLTLENLTDAAAEFYYQVDYELCEIPEDTLYFHAQFRRSNPLPYLTEHVLLEDIEGEGNYIGTYILWGANSSGWWGEGEIKFYYDGDTDFPTICGTGTEDYFCGAYCFGSNYTTPYSGYFAHPGEIRRFSLYRWHINDPITFHQEMKKVTIQALGWRSEGRFLPLTDDLRSVAYFYLDKPCCYRKELPDRNGLEVI